MAYHRDMAQREKISHLRSAEQYGWDACNNARQSTDHGLLAQVQLYMAVIKGRIAEVNERLGVGTPEIRKQKDDALSEITIAIEKVKELRPAKLQESIGFAETWKTRLSPPDSASPSTSDITTPPTGPPLPSPSRSNPVTSDPAAPPPPYSPMSGTFTPLAAAELDTSRPYANVMPPFAELDLSGQLTPARYLQSEYHPHRYSPGGR